MRPLSGANRLVVLAVSIGLLLALAVTVANALGWLGGAVGQAGLPAAFALALASGALFAVAGTRRGRVFGVLVVSVVLAWQVVQAIYERAGDPWILGHGAVFLPLLVALQFLAPSAALLCALWGLYAVARSTGQGTA